MKYLFFLFLPLFSKAQCYEDRIAFNYFIGSPVKTGIEISYFPNDGQIGYDAGAFACITDSHKGKYDNPQPHADAIGRIIFRINQFGELQHAVTAFITTRQIGLSYRFYYRTGDILIGIEPSASTKEFSMNILLTFDLKN